MKAAGWLGLCAALVISRAASAVGGLAAITIIDRETGAVLAPHRFRGEYWVAGTPGARYAIEIRSRSAGRLLAVTSVDGINVISEETAGWGQSGYVLDPGEQYEISGWRKSDTQIAAFTFTPAPDSYAFRTDRSGNIGVIGVAIFRERPPSPLYNPPAISASPSPQESRSADAAAIASPAAPRAPAAGPLQREPTLGTGHGEREYSYVNHTEFARMQATPNEVIRIRYDSLENLIAMGVIRRPRPSALAANPFPASSDDRYVPDPP